MLISYPSERQPVCLSPRMLWAGEDCQGRHLPAHHGQGPASPPEGRWQVPGRGCSLLPWQPRSQGMVPGRGPLLGPHCTPRSRPQSPPRPRILVRLSWSLGALTLSPNVPTAAARPLRSGLVLQGRAWLRRLPSLGLRRGPPPSTGKPASPLASGHASTL